MKKKLTWQTPVYWVLFAAVLLFAFWNAFDGLTDVGPYEWDEARHGVNAYEMLESGNFVLHTYDGEPDYWNVKPPLSMWVMALMYKIFGYNLMGLRFFSAFCLPLIVCISMVFLKKILGNVASLTTGILFAVNGTRFHHLFKTGDPDALFLLVCLLMCVHLYFAFTKSPKHFIGVGIYTALAFLTKAMHVLPLFFVIGLALLFLRKQKKFTLKELLLYLILPMAAPVLLWAVWRFTQDGFEFFRMMFMLDVFNRVTSVVENHSGSMIYYVQVLGTLLGPWVYYGILFTFAATAGSEVSDDKYPSQNWIFLTVFGLMLLCPLVLFSLVPTKLGWYMYSCLIGLFFLTGYCMGRIADRLSEKRKRKSNSVLLTVCALPLIIGFFIIPRKDIHVNASPSSDTGIFAQMDNLEEYQGYSYYSVSTSEAETEMMQSWLLHGMFEGLSHIRGDYAAFQADSTDNLLLVVQFNSEEELAAFSQENTSLTWLCQIQDHALFQLN